MSARRVADVPRTWDWVVEATGKALAVISFIHDDQHPNDGFADDIALLYVLPEARGTGVGRRFIQQLVEHYGPLGGECYGDHRAEFFRRSGFVVNKRGGAYGFVGYPKRRKDTYPRRQKNWGRKYVLNPG